MSIIFDCNYSAALAIAIAIVCCIVGVGWVVALGRYCTILNTVVVSVAV